MTAWPPDLPDPFDPARSNLPPKSEETWSPPAAEEALSREDIEQSAEHFRARFDLLKEEIQKSIVGQDDIVEHLITAMVAGGHVLLEAEPGLGKTVLARSAANALSLQFQRLQFTPDFAPADLVGTNLLIGGNRPNRDDSHFEFIPGPIFCHFLLGDQIDCASTRTQATLLEAMQDRSVTVGGQTRLLGEPFFVLATRNPLEVGEHPLSHAQLDRFFFNLTMPLPTLDDLDTILERTADNTPPAPTPVFPGEDLVLMRDFARGVALEPALRRQIAEVIMATHPQTNFASEIARKCILCGASPRAGQALIMAAKIRALRQGRFYIITEDILACAVPVLKHRISVRPDALSSGWMIEDILNNSFQELWRSWQK